MAKRYSRRSMKLYKWQWEMTNIFDKPQKISMNKIKWLVRKVASFHGIWPPSVKFIKGTISHYVYDPAYPHWPGQIQLSKHHVNIPIILHEMAHAVQWLRYRAKEDDHGPVWLGVFVDLLDTFYVLPKSASVPSLHKAGLDFIPTRFPYRKKKGRKR